MIVFFVFHTLSQLRESEDPFELDVFGADDFDGSQWKQSQPSSHSSSTSSSTPSDVQLQSDDHVGFFTEIRLMIIAVGFLILINIGIIIALWIAFAGVGDKASSLLSDISSPSNSL
jgi:hypothetical protein